MTWLVDFVDGFTMGIPGRGARRTLRPTLFNRRCRNGTRACR